MPHKATPPPMNKATPPPMNIFTVSLSQILDHVEERRKFNSLSVFNFLKAISANPFPRPVSHCCVRSCDADNVQIDEFIYDIWGKMNNYYCCMSTGPECVSQSVWSKLLLLLLLFHNLFVVCCFFCLFVCWFVGLYEIRNFIIDCTR